MFSGNAAGMCHGMFFFSSLSKRQVKWMMGLCEYININYRLMHSCSYAILEHPNLRRGKTKYSQDDWKTKLCGHAVNFELFAKVKVFTGIRTFLRLCSCWVICLKKKTIPLTAGCHLETMPLPPDHSNWVPLLLCFSRGVVLPRLHLCMINDDQPVPTTTVLKIYTGSTPLFYRAGFFPPIRKICSLVKLWIVSPGFGANI